MLISTVAVLASMSNGLLGEVVPIPTEPVDVMRMRLIEDLGVDGKTGQMSYRFRPSSLLCPLAVHLALDIRKAVAEVPRVTDQGIEIVGYIGADKLNNLLKEGR